MPREPIFSSCIRWSAFAIAFGLCLHVSAQIDSEFWFAAPSVTDGHGDAPVLLRFTAFSEDARVSITQPANPQWREIVVNVPAGQSRTMDLTARLALLESFPAFRVLNKGLNIQSDQPITAYYEVDNEFNPDIFSLKGNNALGREFFIPAQNYWPNASGIDPPAHSSFDMVSTQDQTTVTITPNVGVNGNLAGQPFQVSLNRGETYSVEAPGSDTGSQLVGSRVSSDKPIAISIKHDSNLNGDCYDLAGDQIVPINILGTEYIAVQGFLEQGDRVFMLAIQDQTSIVITDGDGNAATVMLNTGQSHNFPLLLQVAHIKSSAPIYVMHVTGFGCEIGMALLPKLECTGSNSVSFTRSTSEDFGVILITENGNQDGFEATSNTQILAEDFFIVPGSNDRYVAARLNLTNSGGSNQSYRISNTNGVFHLGTINGGVRSGTRYGYFSDFKTLKILTEASKICVGASVVLEASGSEDYLWFGSEQVDGLTTEMITVDPDTNTTYGVIGGSSNGCLDTAYLDVSVFEWAMPVLDISPTCTGSLVTFDYLGTEELQSLTWIYDGDTIVTDGSEPFSTSWEIPGPRKVKLIATNPAGCTTDTSLNLEIGGVIVEIDSIHYLTKGESTSGELLITGGNLGAVSLLWSPETGLSCTDCLNPIFSPDQTTNYILTMTDTIGCNSTYQTRVYVDSPIYAPNAFTPNGDRKNDYFEVYGRDVVFEEILIANRWGQIIYHLASQDGIEPTWDGKVLGQDGAAAVYVFFVKGHHTGSKIPFSKEGSFTLLR